MDTPNIEHLRRMSYSELKNVAKQNGIKANMKAEKIITAVLGKCKDENDSFLTLEQKIMNSSKKNKEAKFDEDKEAVSETPRRETYTIPINDNLPVSKEDEALTNSPFLGNLFVDATPESVRISRGSKRKLRDRKVSFVTPVKIPRLNTSLSTPKYISLKDRPKTPIPLKISGVSFTTPNRMKHKESLSLEERKSLPTTPHPSTGKISNPLNRKSGRISGSKRVSFTTPKKIKGKGSQGKKKSLPTTPHPNTGRISNPSNSKKSNEMKSARPPTPMPKDDKIKDSTDSTAKQPSTIALNSNESAVKRKATPNFKKIHEKAFEKMESIDDYQKRKALYSAKKIGKPLHKTPVPKQITSTSKESKIPKAFGGIPFVPSVKSCTDMNLDFSGINKLRQNVLVSVEKKRTTRSVSQNKNSIREKTDKPGLPKVTASKENLTAKRKMKFDLKASLSRKLPYKPHVGPLKPLSEINLNSSIDSTSSCFHKKKEIQNEVVVENRSKSRDVLRGVRKNRRFELQMKNRK